MSKQTDFKRLAVSTLLTPLMALILYALYMSGRSENDLLDLLTHSLPKSYIGFILFGVPTTLILIHFRVRSFAAYTLVGIVLVVLLALKPLTILTVTIVPQLSAFSILIGFIYGVCNWFIMTYKRPDLVKND